MFKCQTKYVSKNRRIEASIQCAKIPRIISISSPDNDIFASKIGRVLYAVLLIPIMGKKKPEMSNASSLAYFTRRGKSLLVLHHIILPDPDNGY